jgi:hypothetical protein
MALASLISQWPSTWITSACTLTCECGTILVCRPVQLDAFKMEMRVVALDASNASMRFVIFSSCVRPMRGNARRFVANAKIATALGSTAI